MPRINLFRKPDNSLVLKDYPLSPDRYVYEFVIKERNRERSIITYNNDHKLGEELRKLHVDINDKFLTNFSERNINSFAYHKGVRTSDALDEHMKSNHFVKLDIHHFFESITEELFFATYPDVFNSLWKKYLHACFYKGSLSIGFVTSPALSDFFMSKFDTKIEEYLKEHPSLHYSRYCDDMLLSSEEEDAESLDKFFEFVKNEINSLGLELNEKKTRRVTLSAEKKNSISFLGLNISKVDEVNNKVTISKRYILFLLFLIEKNIRFKSACKGLVDEINSRVAYLAYNSPVSYARFQKKHLNRFGEEFIFEPKKPIDRKVSFQGDEIPDYSSYLNDFEIEINTKVVDPNTGAIVVRNAIEIKKYKGLNTTVTIPPFITSIGRNAFYGKSVKEVVLPEGLKAIQECAFQNCTVEKINLPSSLLYIGAYAFSYTNITRVVIPERIKAITTHCFYMTPLKEVILNDKLLQIHSGAFESCPNLRSIELPESLIKIENGIFNECSSLENVIYPKCLNYVPERMFTGTNISSLSSFDHVLTFGDYAFSSCHNLKNVTISKNLVSLKARTFHNCSIETINVDKDNLVYDSRDNSNSVIETGKNKLIVTCKNTVLPKSITSIGEYAYSNATMKSIALHEGIVNVENNAFEACALLKEVKLPSSLKELGDNSFSNCISLNKINIPDGIDAIPVACFKSCSNLENLVLPESLKTIEKEAFQLCSKLNGINLPKGLKTIKQSAFSFCYGIKEITIPTGCNRISSTAFAGLSKHLERIIVEPNNLNFYETNGNNCLVRRKDRKLILGCKNSIIPDNCEIIGEYAFSYCTGLKNISIPKSVLTINKFAFADSGVESFDFTNVTNIHDCAFEGCKNLKEIKLNTSVSSIGSKAFANCKNLSSLTLPISLITLGYDAFSGCDELNELNLPKTFNSTLKNALFCADFKLKSFEKITLDKDCVGYTVIDGNLYEINKIINTTTLTLIKATTNKIDNECVSIAECAFKNVKGIKSIVIPENIVQISRAAFSSMPDLEEVIFKTKQTQNLRFDSFLFMNCPKLKNVVLPDTLSSIGRHMFDYCVSLEQISIPRKCQVIGVSAFENCSSLKSVIIQDDSELETIDELAFSKCGLVSITLPEGLKNIYSRAFANIPSLEEINFPSTLISVFDDIFYKTNNIKNISSNHNGITFDNNCLVANNTLIKAFDNAVIDSSIHSIAAYALDEVKGVKSFTLNSYDSFKIQSEYAMSNCVDLEEVTLPSGMKYIPTGYFKDCKKLRNVTLPNTLESIGGEVFEGCESLESIKLPHTLTRIELNAFKGTKVKSIFIPICCNTIVNSDKNELTQITVAKDNKYYKVVNNDYIVDIRTNTLVFANTVDVVVPDSVISIATGALRKDTKTLVLNEGLIDVYPNHLEHLERLEISSTVGVGNRATYALGDFISPEYVSVSKDHPFLITDENNEVLLSKDKETIFTIKKNASIPESVTKIYSDKVLMLFTKVHLPKLYGANCFDHPYLEEVTVDKDNPYIKDEGRNAIVCKVNNHLILGLFNSNIEGLNGIDEYAFKDIKLKNLSIPSSMHHINLKAFYNAEIESITVDKDNPYYDSRNNCNALIATRTNLCLLKSSSTVLPNDVEEIVKKDKNNQGYGQLMYLNTSSNTGSNSGDDDFLPF